MEENKKKNYTKKVKKETKKDVKISIKEVSNGLKLHKYYRTWAEKKYKGINLSLDNWKKVLKRDGLDF
jgi:molybdenum cofactor biosynthesis enzyme MoaA